MSEIIASHVIAELKELLDDNFPVLVERFIVDGQSRIDKIEAALHTLDAAIIYSEAHGLKGSSRNIGAENLGSLFGELEKMGHANNLTDSPTIFAAGKTEFAAVCSVLLASL